jgi:ribosomal protein L19
MLDLIYVKSLINHMVVYDRVVEKPRQHVLQFLLHPDCTKFNTLDYTKQSKKSRRSEKLDVKEKPLLQYSMVGKCITATKARLSSTMGIRNVVNLCPFEMIYAVFAPFLTAIIIRGLFSKLTMYRRSTHYDLRKTSPHRSRADFSFVLWTVVEKKIHEIYDR